LKTRKFVLYGTKIRRKWYFSIVDVVEVLTDSANPQVYGRMQKKRLIAEENKIVINCNGLKIQATDGKMRMTQIKFSD